jgi:CO/xanthine dehydrogenase FAD-binding subunit
MKPSPFAYARVDSVDEAVAALGESGDDVKLLAGGQSLLPAMNFRLVRPLRLLDVGRVRELDYLTFGREEMRIGALRRHSAVVQDAGLHGPWTALREAAACVGNLPVRNRGTFGGSVAHADPAAELAVVTVAFGAKIVARSTAGEREIDASDFFLGPFTTALDPTELVSEIVFATPTAGVASVFEELAPRMGDYALASVCAAVAIDDGQVSFARIGLGSVGATPIRARSAEEALIGRSLDDDAIEEAAQSAARECDPGSDVHASAGYRRTLVAILVERALLRLRGLSS